MIKTTLVAMTIIGCDCDAKLCEYIGETPAQWASVTECEAAMKSQMLHERNFNYPLVSGICRSTQPDAELKTASVPPATQAEMLPAELTHRPSAEIGSPATAAETAAVKPMAYAAVLDDGRGVLYRTANGYAVVRTGLSRVATDTIGIAKSSADWLASKVPHGF